MTVYDCVYPHLATENMTVNVTTAVAAVKPTRTTDTENSTRLSLKIVIWHLTFLRS